MPPPFLFFPLSFFYPRRWLGLCTGFVSVLSSGAPCVQLHVIDYCRHCQSSEVRLDSPLLLAKYSSNDHVKAEIGYTRGGDANWGVERGGLPKQRGFTIPRGVRDGTRA